MKINCSECLGDRHDSCKDEETCLCAEGRHNADINKKHWSENDDLDRMINDASRLQKIKETNPERYESIVAEYKKRRIESEKKFNKKVRLERQFKKEPMEYEDAINESIILEQMLNTGMPEESGDTVGWAVKIIKLLIKRRHLVSRIDIHREISTWARTYGVIFGMSLGDVIQIVFDDPEYFTHIKAISFQLGLRKKDQLFGEKQFVETAYYLMGRYHIKRIELTGTLIFFNDMYYEDAAEQLIRRKARDLLIKSKNGDMNEIVRMIEDSCKVITWKDIENSVHIKCLLNGIYDIKGGVFTETFNPDYIILNQIPHRYDISNSWEEIDKKVTEIIEKANDRESYYDSLSVALHPYTGIDFQFGGVGQPGTGKSQICELSIMTLGDDNVSASPIHLVASDLTTQKDVAFKFLNIDMDMSNETIRNIDVLKRWITQDKFTARGIYEHNTTFRPMARMCFMANDLYEIANGDDAEAIYERTHVIRLDKKFRGEEGQIKNVFEKVATESELSGFITYLLRNATDIYNNQRIRHPINIQTVRDTWNLYGNRIKEFVETWTVKGDFRAETNEVWNRWLKFTNLRGYKAKDKKKFHMIFDEIVGNSPTKTRINEQQVWAFSGFRMLRDDEINICSPLFENNENVYGASQARSSVSSVLSLLNIGENNKNQKLLEVKITELLELIEISKNKGELHET